MMESAMVRAFAKMMIVNEIATGAAMIQVTDGYDGSQMSQGNAAENV